MSRSLARTILLATALLGLVVGFVIEGLSLPLDPAWAWGGATVAVLVPSVVATVRSVWRKQGTGDLIAVLAMAGALVAQQPLTGAVIALMMAGGAALDDYAHRRALQQLRALLGRAPQVAHRRQGDRLADCAVDTLEVGDVLVVKPGEVVPADGVLLAATATLDEAALTGESRLVLEPVGAGLRSGTVNAGVALELRVTAKPADSTYASIVKLVQQAEQQRAPFVRLSERYARWFLVLTLLMCGLTYALSGDLVRVLAVLVVATPCPLIIAAPVALIAGMSRAARHGILVKGGAALEALGAAVVVLLDKTGTVTTATPALTRVETFARHSPEDVLCMAASIEQLSTHALAPVIVREAGRRGLSLPWPTNVHEQPGLGVQGQVCGQRVAVGQPAWVAPDQLGLARATLRRAEAEGTDTAFVAVDGQLSGALVLENSLRPEAPRVIEALRKQGLRAVHLVTGDRAEVAELVGDSLGVDRVFAERSPFDKTELVKRMRQQGTTVLVGDGINDAPALAAADVGIAMGARGATIASESADIVLARDHLDGLREAHAIARDTVRIARQSVIAGMTLSLAAMAVAAAGLLVPLAGAVVQELIDLAVIVNALRALRGRPRAGSATTRVFDALCVEHGQLRSRIDEIAELAAKVGELPAEELAERLRALQASLEQDLLPHEQRDEQRAYPLLRKALAPEDPTGPLVHTHHEIKRRTRLLKRALTRLPETGPEADDQLELRRALYGLHAVLALHFAQEDALYAELSTP